MIQGAQFRAKQESRLAVLAGYTAARLARAKKIPPLNRILKERQTAPQTPAEQTAALKSWAAAAKRQNLAVRVGRRDQPFEPFDLAPVRDRRGHA